MRTIYTLLFLFLFSAAILLNKMLDNLKIVICFIAAFLIIGLCLKSLAEKESIQDFGAGLFYGSLATCILFGVGLFFLINML